MGGGEQPKAGCNLINALGPESGACSEPKQLLFSRQRRPKEKSQSCVFPSSLPSWRVLLWQDRSELQARSVLEKSFRAICGVDRSHTSLGREAALGEFPAWMCLSTLLLPGAAAGSACILSCASAPPFMFFIFQESLNSPGGRETVASLNRCACRGRVLLSECCQDLPSAIVQTQLEEMP